MSQIHTGAARIVTNDAGLAELPHNLGSRPDQLHVAIIEESTRPGANAFLVTSWDELTLTGILYNRATGDPAAGVEVELRWDAEANV